MAYAADESLGRKPMNRDAQTLRQIGEALFGLTWQSDLARELKTSSRTIRRWLAGDSIPDGVWADLNLICLQRAQKLSEMAQSLRLRISGLPSSPERRF